MSGRVRLTVFIVGMLALMGALVVSLWSDILQDKMSPDMWMHYRFEVCPIVGAVILVGLFLGVFFYHRRP